MNDLAWMFFWRGDWHALPLLAVRLTLSILVTVNVLLRKRDIGAAIGWIGLAWLAPVSGGILYALFGINRVRAKARRLKRPRHQKSDPTPDHILELGENLGPLERAVGVITRRQAQPGSHAVMIQNGDQAYPLMLAAMEKAEHSIGLSSYILRDDEAGGKFIDLLIQAHAKGLQVRVLIDGIGGGYFLTPAYHRLRAAGVPAARFMHSPLPWKMPFLNLRNHKKILVIDGINGFSGGLNIAAENCLHLNPRHPVRDTHFHLTGPVVAQISEAFVKDWEFVTGEALSGPAWFPHIPPCPDTAIARVITSGPDEDIEKIEWIAQEAIACAQRSVLIMTPYFLPAENLITTLALAALRGVDVTIVIPQRSNHILIDWATNAHIPPLLRNGCHVWYNPRPFDHSKLMVVDDSWCLIGSSNWDNRSFRLNFEMNIEVYHSELAQQVASVIRKAMNTQLRLHDLTKRKLPLRLRDAGLRLLAPYL